MTPGLTPTLLMVAMALATGLTTGRAFDDNKTKRLRKGNFKAKAKTKMHQDYKMRYLTMSEYQFFRKLFLKFQSISLWSGLASESTAFDAGVVSAGGGGGGARPKTKLEAERKEEWDLGDAYDMSVRQEVRGRNLPVFNCRNELLIRIEHSSVSNIQY